MNDKKELKNFRSLTINNKLYNELTELSETIFATPLSYNQTIAFLINYYKENKTKKLK